MVLQGLTVWVITREAAEQAAWGQVGPSGSTGSGREGWQRISDRSGGETMTEVQYEEDLERAV